MPSTAPEDIVAQVRTSLANGQRLQVGLPGGGRICIERSLPFLVLYRVPESRPDFGAEQLVTSAAAYMICSGQRTGQAVASAIVDELRRHIVGEFGAFLLIEVWTRPPTRAPLVTSLDGSVAAGFRVYGQPATASTDAVVETLLKYLRKARVGGVKAVAEHSDELRAFPLRKRAILRGSDEDLIQVGIEVEPCFRDLEHSTRFPAVLRSVRSCLDRSIRHAVFRFAHRETKHRPRNFHALGRRVVGKAVWDVDTRLEKISSSFDFLLNITPTNSKALWQSFQKSGYESLPRMRYRPLPIDIAQTKRNLFAIPIERIEDPTLQHIAQEKQEELDRKLTMLSDRGTERFMLGSVQLYGRVSGELVRKAEELLERVPASDAVQNQVARLKPGELARMARAELAHYQRHGAEGLDTKVRVTPGIVADMMVSHGELLISSSCSPPAMRAEALIQHEVGTHLVTYFNGSQQQLTQLKYGMAGYVELQEGLAVLAECLVGGMTAHRLRTLAARVIASKTLLDGGDFIDNFRLLCRYGFARRQAFSIALRVYRGGGLIKDGVYLRGIDQLLEHLGSGGAIEPLYAGKFGLEQLPVITELMARGVVSAPRILPRFLARPECQRRLQALAASKKLHLILDEAPSPIA